MSNPVELQSMEFPAAVEDRLREEAITHWNIPRIINQ